MAIYIDADVARRIISSPRSKEQMLLVLSQVEPADVVEVVHGKWIPEPNCYYRCSNCKGHMVSIQNKITYSYCPYCGARMDAERREDGNHS